MSSALDNDPLKVFNHASCSSFKTQYDLLVTPALLKECQRIYTTTSNNITNMRSHVVRKEAKTVKIKFIEPVSCTYTGNDIKISPIEMNALYTHIGKYLSMIEACLERDPLLRKTLAHVSNGVEFFERMHSVDTDISLLATRLGALYTMIHVLSCPDLV